MNKLNKLIFLIAMLLTGHLSAATITWSALSTNVNDNDIFSIDVVGTGFSTTEDTNGGSVNISFDSSVLNVTSVTIDEVVWDFGGLGISTGNIDNVNGTVNDIIVNTFGSVRGDFIVASIQFQAVGAGISGLSLSVGSNPWSTGISYVYPSYIGGSVSVAAVPVPAAVWLFSSGLLGLIGLTRRKSRI